MTKKKVSVLADVSTKSLSIPTSIKCSKCGSIKAVRRDVFLQRAEKFGSIDKLLTNYRCQQCRNGVKRGIQCVRCKEIKAVRKDVYKKRVERYGSEDVLLAKYLCRRCRKIVKHEQRVRERKARGKNVSIL